MKRLLQFFLHLTPFRIAVALTGLVLLADAAEPRFLQTIDLKALDLKFVTRGIQKPSDRVAIVAIDEKSVKELGRWPWPRWTHGQLTEKLANAGAKAIGFDIVFSEPDQNSELVKLQELIRLYKETGLGVKPEFSTQLPAEFAVEATALSLPLVAASERFHRYLVESESKANSDKYFAEMVTAHREKVILGYFFYGAEVNKSQLAQLQHDDSQVRHIEASRVSLVAESAGDWPDSTWGMSAVVPNIPELSAATDNYGHFYMLPDPQDGVIRWNNLVLKYEGGYYPSLGLKIAAVALDQQIMLRFIEGMVSEVRLGDLIIPVDEAGRLLVNFAGPLAIDDKEDVTFAVYSYTDILNDRIPAEELKDKIFVVGPTAVGIYDLRNTPFDPAYPGVGVHANVISNILDLNFVQKPGWMKLFDVIIIIAFGLFLGTVLGRLRGVAGAITAGALAVGYWLFTQYAFVEWGVWLSTVYPELEVVLVFASIVTFKYMTEERQAKQIRGAFSSYVTPSIVEAVLKDPSRLKLGGENRELTVMFSDVRGFTSISEKLTAEQLVDLLNAYLSKMTDLVFQSDGTLDKYIGDALMAIWGAPVEQPDHAKRACFTAIDMLNLLEKELKPKWDREGLKHIPAGQIPDVSVGIGLNTGIMSVGNMGSDQRFDYTVMGDNVNLASRLEGTNKAYATGIIISDSTRKAVGDAIVVRELDRIRVKGKNEPVTIYELVGKTGEVDSGTLEKVRLFEEGLAYYRKQEWDLAEGTWRRLLEAYPDPTTEIFLDRVAENRGIELPPDWDGVYVMTTK